MSLEETKAALSANRAPTQSQAPGSPSRTELASRREPLDALSRDARRSGSGMAGLPFGRPINLERRARFGRFGFGA